jgi:hypothetical protein
MTSGSGPWSLDIRETTETLYPSGANQKLQAYARFSFYIRIKTVLLKEPYYEPAIKTPDHHHQFATWLFVLGAGERK